MVRNAIRAAVLALAFIGAPAAADYAAGQRAWDAGAFDEALSAWRGAADAGDPRSMLALGRRHAQGIGAVQDYVEAHKWLNIAASLGEAAAAAERDGLAAKMTPQQVAAAQERAAAWRPGQAASGEAGRAAGARFRDCDECPELVVVPAGSFNMGSPQSEAGRFYWEGPVHRVTIERPFAVGVYEVTYAEWDACVSGGGCGGYRPKDWGWGRGNRPVISVSWPYAKAYVRWLSEKTGEAYRLPSESEWEYAARAGTRTPFHTGGTISTEQANYDGRGTYGSGRRGQYREGTVAVGSFGANDFGLHDVHGNVREWVEDCWNDSYLGAPADGSAWGSGDCSGHVLRGGSWSHEPRYLRSAFRSWLDDGWWEIDAGFRVARTLTP